MDALYRRFTGPARVVCHGTIYNVQYGRDVKPINTPADRFADLFTSGVKMEPLSVGTTGLDAVLSFLKTHQDQEDPILGEDSTSVANELLSLSELLYATEDSFDARVKASDLIDAHNFGPSSGGNAWHFDGKAEAGGPPALPKSTPVADDDPLSEIDYLIRVNDLQSLLDTADRKLELTKWSLFAVWWAFVSDPHNSDVTRQQEYQAKSSALRTEGTRLDKLISSLRRQIELIVREEQPEGPLLWPKVRARRIPQPSFFQRRDPTVCIAGMESGWPTEYLGMVVVTLLFPPSDIPEEDWRPFVAEVGDINVAYALYRLYIDAISSEDHGGALGFKQWTGQPWCPLYVRYGIKERLADDLQNASDQRVVSGRIILLPQPAVNLQALVNQVITDPKVTLTTEQREELLANIGKLKFACAELSGLTNHLLTLSDGSHVQPNLQIPGETGSLPLEAAVAAGLGSGITREDLALIGGESALTPYGSLFDFSNAVTSPFKGVTHGQLRFTKLNIVDKFGQVVSAIPPGPTLRSPDRRYSDTLYPCLGDQTEADPQLPDGYPLCPYVQLTPTINQAARINAAFVLPSKDSNSAFAGWKPSNDWEQPVRAWVIVNYADYGLQFFTADGTFYVEMTLGGPTNTITSPKWLPFDPPSPGSDLVSPQLEQLIAHMTGPTGSAYLRGFWSMINGAVATMPFVPGDYAAYATSIVGKPFALVNVGFGLELALPPLQSQTTLGPDLIPTPPSEADTLFSYKFPLKIGDKDRPYDGVVGYFDTDNTAGDGTTNWKTLHTYFGSGSGPLETGDPREEIIPANFPVMSPYYIEPDEHFKEGGFQAAHAQRLMVKSMLVDPYTPLHAYSPILPMRALQLPAWTVQEALRKMSAFFRLGPILITRDIPPTYDATHPLAADTWVKLQQEHAASKETAPIRLPIGGAKKGLWAWLQPYADVDGSDGDPEAERKYNWLEVGEDDGQIRLDPAPYTMVEGFLQLVQPLNKSDVS